MPRQAELGSRRSQTGVWERDKNDQIQLIINTTEGKQAISDSFTMRREALQHRVTYYTTMAGAKAACYALGELDAGDVNCLQDLHKSLK